MCSQRSIKDVVDRTLLTPLPHPTPPHIYIYIYIMKITQNAQATGHGISNYPSGKTREWWNLGTLKPNKWRVSQLEKMRLCPSSWWDFFPWRLVGSEYIILMGLGLVLMTWGLLMYDWLMVFLFFCKPIFFASPCGLHNQLLKYILPGSAAGAATQHVSFHHMSSYVIHLSSMFKFWSLLFKK